MTTAFRPYVVTEESFPIPPAQALSLVCRELGGILVFPTQKFDVRVEIPSRSVELTVYRICRNRETGAWSCGCKGWIYWHTRKGEICCQHLKEWVPALEAALELQTLALPQPAGVWFHPPEKGGWRR